MLRIVTLIILVGIAYLFLNWDDYRTDVENAVDVIDDVAEQTKDMREDIYEKIEELKGE